MKIMNKPSSEIDKLCSFNFDCICGARLRVEPEDIEIVINHSDINPVIYCLGCLEPHIVNSALLAVCNRDYVDYDKFLVELNNIKPATRDSEQPTGESDVPSMNLFGSKRISNEESYLKRKVREKYGERK